jgi:hypothetical protein
VSRSLPVSACCHRMTIRTFIWRSKMPRSSVHIVQRYSDLTRDLMWKPLSPLVFISKNLADVIRERRPYRVAPAVSRHHRQCRGTGVRPHHRWLEAAAAGEAPRRLRHRPGAAYAVIVCTRAANQSDHSAKASAPRGARAGPVGVDGLLRR